MSDQQLLEAYDDVYYFCCSFVDKTIEHKIPIEECSIDFFTLKKFYNRMSKMSENDKSIDML